VRTLGAIRNWCCVHPRSVLALGTLVGAIGVVILLGAVTQTDFPSAVALSVLGAFVGSGSLLLFREIFALWFRVEDNRFAGLLVGLGLVAVGAAFVWAGVVGERSSAAALGVFAAILGALAFSVRLRDSAVNHPWVWTVAGLALMLVGGLRLANDEGALAINAGLWLGGLTAFKLGFLPVVDLLTPDNGALLPTPKALAKRRTRLIVALVACGVATACGALFVTVGTAAPHRGLLLFGALTSIAAVSGLGLAATRLTLPPGAWWLVFVAGAVAVIVAVPWVGLTFDWRGLALVVAGIFVVVGAWFVFRGEGLVFLVLAGFVLVWALVERNDDTIPSLAADTPAILAIGDSFISGEGADTFIEGTNTKAADGNTCRRAATSYPYLVAAAQNPPMQAISLACSGAVSAEIHKEPQKRNVDSTIAGWLPQLDSLTHTDPVIVDPRAREAVEVVLVSIGGNDTGFETIVMACLLPANCSDQRERWFAKAESLEGRLARTYQRIDRATGDAHVVVVPYPLFVDTRECGNVASVEEFAFVVEFVEVLNATIARAARTAGVVVADTSRAFDGHFQCDPEPAANMIVLAPPDGPISARLDPGAWVHGSMHPNAVGHQRQAEVLIPLVAALRAGEDPQPWLVDLQAVPESALGVPAVERAMLLEDAQSQLTDRRWITEQLFAAARALAGPIALLIGGGMLMALAATGLRWRWARFLAPRRPSTPNAELEDRQLHLIALSACRTSVDVLCVVPGTTAPHDAAVVDEDRTRLASLDTWRCFAGGEHTFHWAKTTVPNLSPDTSHVVRAIADEPFEPSPTAVATTLPAESTTSLSLVVGSCFDRENQQARENLAAAYLTAAPLDEQPRPLQLWLGDQVYIDAPWTEGLRVADAAELVARKYLDTWEIGRPVERGGTIPVDKAMRDPEQAFGAALRGSSNFFLPDDHEFWNGYPKLSFLTLTLQAVRRAIKLAIGWVRKATAQHPTSHGPFANAAGRGFVVFQSNVDFAGYDDFTADKNPPAVQVRDFAEVRLVMVDTRWSRSFLKSTRNARLMPEESLKRVLDELDPDGPGGDKLVVLAVSRPMIGNLPRGKTLYQFEAGAEAYTAQYQQLCRRIADRADAGRPTLIVSGDVHKQAVRSAIDHRVLEVVSSPMGFLGGGWFASVQKKIMNVIEDTRGAANAIRAALRLGIPPDDAFLKRFGDDYEPHPGHTHFTEDDYDDVRDGLVRLDLDLSTARRPVLTYELFPTTGARLPNETFTWDPDAGWLRVG